LRAFEGDEDLQNQIVTNYPEDGMEEVIGSIPIRSTNKSNDLAKIIKSARYAFDTLVLMLHSPQHLLHS